ncbi:MAG: PAS domain S-box protein [Thermodesulfobacteriota bacterium]
MLNNQCALKNEIKEREHTEKALGESEKRYRTLFEGSRDAIYITTREGKVIDFNQSFLDLFGYSKEEMRGLNAQDTYVHSEDRSRFQQEIEQNGFVRDFELKLRKKDRTEIDCLLTSSVQRTHDGNILGYQGIIRDITERKRAEESLRESEERFRSLFENAMIGIYRTTPDGQILIANPALIKMLGYTSFEELAQLNVVQKGYAEGYSRTQFTELMERDGYVLGLESGWKRKDGAVLFVRESARAFRDVQGNILYYEGTVEDNTERKHAEQALRESEERYRNILDAIEDGYFEADIAGNFTFFNNSLQKIFGYSKEELIGVNNRQYMDKEMAKKVYQRFNRVYTTGEPAKAFEYEIIRKDFTKRILEGSISLIRNAKGERIGFRVIARDITERKRAEEEMRSLQEQLRQSQKMEAIGRLAGGIAHDFNNLLTIIKGYSQLSLLDLKERDPLKGNIQEIQKASQRATDLTRQLLAFSRRQMMEMKVLNLNVLLKDLDKMLRRVIGEDIELVNSLADDLGQVKTDPGQIEQVIMNLAVNARDAMPKGGKLTIETANVELDEAYARAHIGVTPGRYVMLSMSDTGVGMTPDVRERIFEPFFTTKEKGEGTGLGLSMVYGIVKQSGGSIWVYSEPVQGTTFKIYLPRVDELPEEIGKKEIKEEIPWGNETVLVVEDDEAVRKLAVKVLEKQGYNVLEASNGTDALEICEKQKGSIHMILTDVVMPEMNGRQLVERFRQVYPYFKVLYMSGYTDNTIVHHGVLEKGVNYIQKPFTPEALARKVREVLDK